VIDVAFAIPGDIDTHSGGYGYARKIMALLPDYGIAAHRLTLPQAYPFPSTHDLERTAHLFAQLAPDTMTMIDGLAFGAMPPHLADSIRQPIVAIVHHPLAYETGITPADERRFRAFETHALARAHHVITSSSATADVLTTEYKVPSSKLTVAEPGTNPALRSQGSGPGAPLALIAVGAVIPRKGYGVLIEALKHLADLHWHLTIVGDMDRDLTATNDLRRHLLQSGLRSHVTLAGTLSDRHLQRQYARSDVFVMPSLYEGYGMVLTEAVARGLPVVCTSAGAMADTAPDDASLKVPAGDAPALSKALRKVISDQDLRHRLADNSWQHARQLPRWEGTVKKIADVLMTVRNGSRNEGSL
jgi:glycosyltransferase involved in cell wall biosynthesis